MKIAILPGDGIGTEIMAEAVKVLGALDLKFETETALVGGAAYEAHGHPLPDSTLSLAKAADAVLFGAVGDWKYDKLERALRPEQAILGLRKHLGLFANFRPAICYEELTHASSLKPELIAGLDILIIRELTGDIYFGQPRGRRTAVDGHFPGAEEAFDVIVTGNMFGDILSDEAAMLTGSIGMLPSASLDRHNKGLYEPSHGSAPDIAGKGVANPLATILSAAMMLRFTLNQPEAADRIESAVKAVLAAGLRTGDIWSEGTRRVGTRDMGDAVLAALTGKTITKS